jgi:hypothetical protein
MRDHARRQRRQVAVGRVVERPRPQTHHVRRGVGVVKPEQPGQLERFSVRPDRLV